MKRLVRRGDVCCPLLVAFLVLVSPTFAPAQMAGTPRSLGGYGAATIGANYQSGGSGALIPYASGIGGYIPYQSLEPRSVAATLASRLLRETSIGGIGNGSMGIPIGGASRMTSPGRIYSPLNTRAEMGGVPSMRGAGRTIGFGSPFRQPPNLGGGGGGGVMGAM